MLFEITSPIHEKIQIAKLANMPAEQILPKLQLAVSTYLEFVWDKFWLTGQASLDEMLQAIDAISSDSGTGYILWHLPYDGLAHRLSNTRKLVQAGVPYASEFCLMLAQKTRPNKLALEQLRYLMEQIHDAATEDVDLMMAQMADLLQNHLLLRVGKQRYQITELEFYYRRKGHLDPYPHGKSGQMEFGKWFFNDADGLDLTFGDRQKGIHGGILLRGLRRLPLENPLEYISPDDPTYIWGPRKVLADIVANLNGVFTHLPGLMLEEAAKGPVAKTAPWRVRRYALRHKAEDTDTEYLHRPYRFLVDIDYLRGLKDRADVVRQLGWTADEAKAVLGYRPSLINRLKALN
ncbi:hypothetical protein [Hymenobacter sp. B1770]|uniref:hypothetical protein n=1 Tax=Hymenobacter sp. B1770 TaxID=1718788 RepID=UPI003CF0CA38